MSELDIVVGRSINRARRARGFTVAQTAEKLGCSADDLERWEAGLAPVGLETLVHVSIVLDIHPRVIIAEMAVEQPELKRLAKGAGEVFDIYRYTKQSGRT